MTRLNPSAELAERAPAPPSRCMTEEEFVAWCDEDTRAEWVDGEVVVRSPASARHSDIVGFLCVVLRCFSAARDLGRILGPEFAVRLPAQRRRRLPDLLFVSRERLD